MNGVLTVIICVFLVEFIVGFAVITFLDWMEMWNNFEDTLEEHPPTEFEDPYNVDH